MSKTVVAVIPARYASRRFPGKALAPIAGTAMVVRVLANVRQAALVSRVLVATDDRRIAAVVDEAGGEVVMTSPALPSGSDRVWSAVKDIPADVIVNVQGDEPLLPATVVDSLVKQLLVDDRYDISTPVTEVTRAGAASPDVVTVVRDETGAAVYFSRAIVPYGTDLLWRHIGIYAYRRSALERYVAADPTSLERCERLEQLRALALGLRIGTVEVGAATHAVDRPDDVAVVERLLQGGNQPAHDIRLVVLDVDGVLTPGHISYLGDDGQLLTFDVKDGYGITALIAAGIDVAVLSSRDSPALRRRATELGISRLRAGVSDKSAAFVDLIGELGVGPMHVCYVGDDDPDVEVMALAGLSAAPADAAPNAQAHAILRLTRPGGRGAVRELADLLLSPASTTVRRRD